MLKPEDNIWVHFEEATLHVLGEKEEEIHRERSSIHYGMPKKDKVAIVGTVESKIGYKPYLLFLEDLKGKVGSWICSLKFREINKMTEVRRTITGGLQIRRKSYNGYRKYYTDTATLSREEYKTLAQYLRG